MSGDVYVFSEKVKLVEPDLDLQLEISDKAYVFSERISGLGGLPVGSQGKVACLIENQRSLLAALLMMKRGCSVMLFNFNKIDYSMIEKYCYGFKLKFQEIQSIAELEDYAKKMKIKCLVVGQVLADLKQLDTDLTVFKPLISYSDNQIKELIKHYL